MDFQMNMAYLAANWLPLLIALVVGYFFGWLFTGRPAGKRAKEAEAALATANSKQRDIQKKLDDALKDAETKASTIKQNAEALQKKGAELDEAKARNESLAEELTGAIAELSDKNDQIEMLNASLLSNVSELEAATRRVTHVEDMLTQTKNQLGTELEAKAQDITALTGELDAAGAAQEKLSADLDSAYADLTATALELDQFRTANSGLAAELEDAKAARTALEQKLAESVALSEEEDDELQVIQTQLDGLASQLEAAQDEIRRKDTALSEAYARAVALESGMQDKDSLVASARMDVDDAKRMLSEVNEQNRELKARITQVRGEVAGEMALMTSTMMREKDSVIADANARIAALSEELRVLKASSGAQ